jgi:hypothetical protein
MAMSTPAAEPSGVTQLPPAVQALDAAVRGISGVLELSQVLQLIVDRVRELVGARYAALGIVDEQGLITEFITSGITAEQRAAIGDLPHGRGLLGLIIRENRAYRIPRIQAHPESYGFPPNHPPMTRPWSRCSPCTPGSPWSGRGSTSRSSAWPSSTSVIGSAGSCTTASSR